MSLILCNGAPNSELCLTFLWDGAWVSKVSCSPWGLLLWSSRREVMALIMDCCFAMMLWNMSTWLGPIIHGRYSPDHWLCIVVLSLFTVCVIRVGNRLKSEETPKVSVLTVSFKITFFLAILSYHYCRPIRVSNWGSACHLCRRFHEVGNATPRHEKQYGNVPGCCNTKISYALSCRKSVLKEGAEPSCLTVYKVQKPWKKSLIQWKRWYANHKSIKQHKIQQKWSPNTWRKLYATLHVISWDYSYVYREGNIHICFYYMDAIFY